MKITRQDAIGRGFIIDDHCYPPCAYQGPRFNPTHRFYTYTELETDLLALRDAVGAISQQDYTALAAAYEKVK